MNKGKRARDLDIQDKGFSQAELDWRKRESSVEIHVTSHAAAAAASGSVKKKNISHNIYIYTRGYHEFYTYVLYANIKTYYDSKYSVIERIRTPSRIVASLIVGS